MVVFQMPYPRICLSCIYYDGDEECLMRHQYLTEEAIYDEKPEECWLKKITDEIVTIDNEKVPDGAVIDLGAIEVEQGIFVQEEGENDDEEV